MKETKMYIDGELPKVCNECVCCDSFSFCHALNKHCLKTCDTQRLDNCPLIDIKTHDRELIKEVCEKIKEQLGFIVDGQERIVCDGSATGYKTILAVLNQIQKEFEK